MKRTWIIGLIIYGTFTVTSCSSTIDITTTDPTPIPTLFSTTDVEDTTFLPEETSPTEFPEATKTTVIEPTETIMKTEADDQMITPTITSSEETPTLPLANVISVHVSEAENNYQFSVEISSPDTGCEQYADWWEVVSEDGELIYRRILAHSHVSEQPFTRSGGPVEISADTIVIVRAHMHPDGYGGVAFKGSVQAGFEEVQLEADFALDLELADPLPDGCAF